MTTARNISGAGAKAGAEGRGVRGRPRTVDTAYNGIRKAIVQGELRAGDQLREQELAVRLGVSRTPVREALNMLSAEGLVVLERYRGGRVAHFTEDDVYEIWKLRAQLEGYAAGRAATRITEAQLERMEALQDEMERIFAEKGWYNSVLEFDELNSEFHAVVAEAARSPRLEGILHHSLDFPASVLRQYAEPLDDRTRRTFRQHRELIDALRLRNPDWAEAQMSAHLASLIVTEGTPRHGTRAIPAEDDEGTGDGG